jgi:RNA polymerase sigma-70 factor (ECF subfamily)
MAVHSASVSLVEAAKAGDDAAFDALLEPLLQPAYRLACAMLHDHRAAEDVVQEASFKAWRKLMQLRAGAEMRPWFLGIVANECRTTRRSRWWSVVRSDITPEVAVAEDEAIVEGIELRRALRSIEERKRLVLYLYYWLDLPVDEIAIITKTTVHAAESRLARGVQELRRRMEASRGRR